MNRRVVVTGLGVVTSLSCKVEDLWERVLAWDNNDDKDSDDGTSKDLAIAPSRVQRPLDLQIGTPLSNASAPPTASELQMISERLGEDLHEELQNILDDSNHTTTKERVVSEGECLVNLPGSIHQSFAKGVRDKEGTIQQSNGCLLWALGPNVHVHCPPIDDKD